MGKRSGVAVVFALIAAGAAYDISHDDHLDLEPTLDQIVTSVLPTGVIGVSAKNLPDLDFVAAGNTSDAAAAYNWHWDGRVVHEQAEYFGAHTQVKKTGLALWYGAPRWLGEASWLLDVQDLPEENIVGLDRIEVLYVKDGSTLRERLQIGERHIEKTDTGYKISAKTDGRTAELMREGSFLEVHYDRGEGATERFAAFRMNLNGGMAQVEAKSVIGDLMDQVSEIDPGCCQPSTITPFSETYLAGIHLCTQEGYEYEQCVFIVKNADASDISTYQEFLVDRKVAARQAEQEREAKEAREAAQARAAEEAYKRELDARVEANKQQLIAKQRQLENYHRVLNNFRFADPGCDFPGRLNQNMPERYSQDQLERQDGKLENYLYCLNEAKEDDMRAFGRLIRGELGGKFEDEGAGGNITWNVPDSSLKPRAKELMQSITDRFNSRGARYSQGMDHQNEMIGAWNSYQRMEDEAQQSRDQMWDDLIRASQ